MDLLGADGLREVAERGMEVGSHGRSHIRLSGLDPGVLEEEVSESRRILEAVLDGGVAGFCYPYGSLDGRAIRAVRRAGYDYACAYKTRVERSLYDIPRTYVGERDGDLRLALKLRGLPRYARRLLP